MSDFESLQEQGPSVPSVRKHQTGAGVYCLRKALENMGALEKSVVTEAPKEVLPQYAVPAEKGIPVNVGPIVVETGHDIDTIRRTIEELTQPSSGELELV